MLLNKFILVPKQNSLNDLLKILFIGLLVIIGTFPENDLTFTTGIDPPLAWVYNYLYYHGLIVGKDIIFPHGPLAFFMYPLQENILIETIVTSFLKILLIFNLLKLFYNSGTSKWSLTLIIAYFISIIANFNHLILTNIILLYFNYYHTKNTGFKLLAFVLTAFAFYVKSYVAILSGIITFSFLTYFIVSDRNYKKLAIDIITILGLLLLYWLLMYGTFSGFIKYATGMYYLAQDNSSAASYYPYNNWWLLSIFLLIIFSIAYLNKSKSSLFFLILISLSLFAAWKHGMAREDLSHVKGFLVYLIIVLSILVISGKENIFRNLTFSMVAVFLLIINMANSVNYVSPKYDLFGINNFIGLITDFSGIKSSANRIICNNTSKNKLNQAILDSIKSETVDVYPWDYTIISTNNLNWQPRVVIQSYASYNSWLDNQNAKHFISDKAPTFFIWEINKNAGDINAGKMESIDYRALLNDEPQTILQILRNYKPFYNDEKFMIFKRRLKPLKISKAIVGNLKTKWGKWISAPNAKGDLLRVKLSFNKSILQCLKSFLYKDEQFWIYLKLSNGLIHKYRIVPKNAKDGIWINPYILNPANHFIEPNVEEILFKCSNQNIMTDSLLIEWEQIDFEDKNYILQFFNKSLEPKAKEFVNSMNSYENESIINWSKLSASKIINKDFFSGSKAQVLTPNSYSGAYSCTMDTIPFCNLQITADCWVKSEKYNYSRQVILVISIDDNNGNILWKAVPVDDQLIDRMQWNNIFNAIYYSHARLNCKLNAYLWNASNTDILIDDFRITVNSYNP